MNIIWHLGTSVDINCHSVEPCVVSNEAIKKKQFVLNDHTHDLSQTKEMQV
jgi:hypothetical protein